MSNAQDSFHARLKLFAGIGAVLVIFLMWIEGAFTSKTDPGILEEAQGPDLSPAFHIQIKETQDKVDWPAHVQARKEIELAPKYPGRILEISVTPGTAVVRGQLLARLESAESDARLQQAKAQLDLAQAASTRAAVDAQRLRHLYDKEATTRQALDAGIAEERQNAAKALEAKNLVRQMESQWSESQIRAPFDGVINQRLKDPGDMALQGQPILTFLETPALRIEASLPASCIADLKTGDRVSFKTGHDAPSGTGILEEIAPASDLATETILIKARIEPTDHSPPPLPGTFIWLEHACHNEFLMLIPASAVTRIGQLETVSVIQKGQPHIRHVRTGRSFDQDIEILSGLQEGEDILLGGHP